MNQTNKSYLSGHKSLRPKLVTGFLLMLTTLLPLGCGSETPTYTPTYIPVQEITAIAWSPNSKQLKWVYESLKEGHIDNEQFQGRISLSRNRWLYQIDVDGKNLKQLDGAYKDESLSWSVHAQQASGWDFEIRNGQELLHLKSGQSKPLLLEFQTDPQEQLQQAQLRLQTQPADARSYFQRGLAYFALGKYSQARQDFDQAIKLWPEYSEAHYYRGRLALLEKRNSDAWLDFDVLKRAGDGQDLAWLFGAQAITSAMGSLEYDDGKRNPYQEACQIGNRNACFNWNWAPDWPGKTHFISFPLADHQVYVVYSRPEPEESLSRPGNGYTASYRYEQFNGLIHPIKVSHVFHAHGYLNTETGRVEHLQIIRDYLQDQGEESLFLPIGWQGTDSFAYVYTPEKQTLPKVYLYHPSSKISDELGPAPISIADYRNHIFSPDGLKMAYPDQGELVVSDLLGHNPQKIFNFKDLLPRGGEKLKPWY